MSVELPLKPCKICGTLTRSELRLNSVVCGTCFRQTLDGAGCDPIDPLSKIKASMRVRHRECGEARDVSFYNLRRGGHPALSARKRERQRPKTASRKRKQFNEPRMPGVNRSTPTRGLAHLGG